MMAASTPGAEIPNPPKEAFRSQTAGFSPQTLSHTFSNPYYGCQLAYNQQCIELKFGRQDLVAPKLADARLNSIYAPDMMVGTRLGSEDKELEINHNHEVSETSDRALNGEHDSDSDSDVRG